jgi:hypothetical protein
MNIACCYVYPQDGAGPYRELAAEFVAGRNHFQPGVKHRTVIMCNGSEPSDESKYMFSAIPDCEMVVHDNSGYDIGAYQQFARMNHDADLLVFFGASTYFRGHGWMKRMRDSLIKHGDLLFGAMGHCGGNVNAHIRTTGFWCHPGLMNSYPHKVTSPDQRYPFEHGQQSITDWSIRRGTRPMVVTFVGEYDLGHWSDIPGGYHNGSQEYMIVGDRMSRPPYYPVI